MNRRSTRLPFLLGAMWIAAAVAAGSCNYSSSYTLTSSSGTSAGTAGGGLGGASSTNPSGDAGDPGTTSASGGVSSGAGLGGQAGSGAAQGGTGCVYRCADDLQSIVDCNGKVVLKCAPDQGCVGDQCTGSTPCDTAAQAHSSYG